MGEVLLKYRVMPEGPETDLGELESNLKAAMPEGIANVQGCEAVPFAFGMKALITTIVVQDDEGNNDKVEDAVNNCAGVQGAELLEMGRLM